ncbi:hypothetical protein [Thalassomonas actiniarum]|uniref:Uncharacterized protein n=1 Tax=Thalassomonas actiniarum TaxID=485447 RepID=A0AAF0C4P9_9GAMM|nr:hypothetical protein [Thalassomonas actiniarum]WDE00718.1 hypothetical protein SG35_008850 [Thalassomonas actiniarum]
MPLRNSSTTCIQCKKDIKIAKNIGPFSLVTCPRCNFSVSYRELQKRTQETAKRFADEFKNKLYQSEQDLP